jgi:hypothetical protein
MTESTGSRSGRAREPVNTYGTIGFVGTQTNWTQVLSERPGIPATGNFA